MTQIVIRSPSADLITSEVASLPSPKRLLVVGILLPAFVAISNQFLFHVVQENYHLRHWMFPWMAVSTAVLGWCTGRYLAPAWFRWLVFGWSLVLLDSLTIAACLSSPVSHDLAFALIAAQGGLLVVWTVLADVIWQQRLPTAMAAAAILVAFTKFWNDWQWPALVTFAVLFVLVACGFLRWFGFKVRSADTETLRVEGVDSLGTTQFGIRHMLIWSAAIAPLLLVARGLDLIAFAGAKGQGALPTMVVSLSLATIALSTIWAVLGNGRWPIRIAALVIVPVVVANALELYSHFAGVSIGTLSVRWPAGAILSLMYEMRRQWMVWLGSYAAILAALLLFLRASGYRLRKAS